MSVQLPKGDRMRQVKARSVVVAAAAGVLLVVAGGVMLVPRMICTTEQRAAFNEFPHYGGVALEPRATHPFVGSGCYGVYTSAAPHEEIAAYYREQLAVQGWHVEAVEEQHAVQGWHVEAVEEQHWSIEAHMTEEHGFIEEGVFAHREGLIYWVGLEPNEWAYDGKAHVTVSVYSKPRGSGEDWN